MKHFGEAIQGKENESVLPGIHNKPRAVTRAAAAPSISASQGRKFLANKLAMRHNKVRHSALQCRGRSRATGLAEERRSEQAAEQAL